jgi:thiamine-phosphate pyrophosphorylase
MKFLYVTDGAAIGPVRLRGVLRSLAGVEDLSVQLREKGSTDREVVGLARDARKALGPDVAVFVNGRFDLALVAAAEGVHLPAEGLPLSRVRVRVPRGFRIGVSAHSPAEAARAISEGADLVVIGPIFDTPSKRAYGSPLGPAALAELPARESHSADVFAIGGFDESNVGELAHFADRISGVAAVRAVQEALDPRSVVERMTAVA